MDNRKGNAMETWIGRMVGAAALMVACTGCSAGGGGLGERQGTVVKIKKKSTHRDVQDEEAARKSLIHPV